MAEYILTDDAQTDLAWLYREGLELFGEHQADLYLDELYHLFKLLAENPGMGFDFEVQGKKFQRHPHKAHVIIFEPIDNQSGLVPGVKILRVFFGASDYLRSLS